MHVASGGSAVAACALTAVALGCVHAHCCPCLAGVRTRFRHNPRDEEWCSFLRSAGRFVELEQRDPTLGPGARLDIVEVASVEGGAVAYDVNIVTTHQMDTRFVRHCASTPGYAARRRYYAKLDDQYAGRLSHARLLPLIAESGSHWHPEAQKLLWQLARAYVNRTPGTDKSALGAVVARWASRLSAALLRGNAAARQAAGWTPAPAPCDARRLRPT